MMISITRPPRQLRTWEYYIQNRTIKLDFMKRQRQVLECFWKSDQKSTLIAGFRSRNEGDTSRGSKPVRIGDLHMGLISRLQCVDPRSILAEQRTMPDEATKVGMWNTDAHVCAPSLFSSQCVYIYPTSTGNFPSLEIN